MFKDRVEAGLLLAKKLEKYKNQSVIVYGMPRGGVVTAFETAKYLHAPLDLIITRKISHPDSPEYAIGAVAENGHMVVEPNEAKYVDKDWLKSEIELQKREVSRRKELYLKGRKTLSPKGKVAILVDDGVATGLTLRVGILELRHLNPERIVVAVPVISQSTADVIKAEADELIALEIPTDSEFLGAVGSYYDSFSQVEDEEVIKTLKDLV